MGMNLPEPYYHLHYFSPRNKKLIRVKHENEIIYLLLMYVCVNMVTIIIYSNSLDGIRNSIERHLMSRMRAKK